MTANLLQALAPIHEKRRYYQDNPKMVSEIMAQGSRKAGLIARKTMQEVRAALKITY